MCYTLLCYGCSTYSILSYIYTWRVLKNMAIVASRLVGIGRGREVVQSREDDMVFYIVMRAMGCFGAMFILGNEM